MAAADVINAALDAYEKGLPAPIITQLPVCTMCGCPVADSAVHRRWHAQQERLAPVRPIRGCGQ